MAESERRQRVISSTPRLSPDDVANRAFATGFRGYSESEVRAFLKRVAEELVAAREREEELANAVDELEEQLRSPRPLDEQELLDALGEETARLLRSAREAADDIRRKAEERSGRVMEEAQAEAHRLRTEAAEILGVRTQEAEAHAAELLAEAEAGAAAAREAAERAAEDHRARGEREAESIIDAARAQGREMLDEARAARERVLADLSRRRSLLQAQVEELRQGRDRLLDAYRVVKRTFLDATEALAQVEARAASERATGADAEESAVAGSADGAAGDGDAGARDGEGAGAGVGPEGASADENRVDEATSVGGPGEGEERRAHGLADVDSLFARIRAGHSTEPGEEHAGDPDAAPTGAPAPAGEDEVEVEEIDLAAAEVARVDAPAADQWRARHAADLQGLLGPLLKRAKRAAQDEQNALLDAVRRHKGRPAAVQVLPSPDDAAAAWGAVAREALDAAYAAGAAAAGGDVTELPDGARAEIAGQVVAGLRDRVAHSIDDGGDGDTSGLVERIGARYREWKNQRLEQVLGDALVAAWTLGVYDATPDGAQLHWVPLVEGRCADCDDNALEPTVKGSAFPTGQLHPPAHDGCRCLLAPAAVMATASS
jgi:DivIVA domain-containing protein